MHERLDLVRRWTRYGEPIVVGSVASRMASWPLPQRASEWRPTLPSGLYWKLDYQADDGNVWTIDMWLLDSGARRRGLDATARLGPLLTDDRRAVISSS